MELRYFSPVSHIEAQANVPQESPPFFAYLKTIGNKFHQPVLFQFIAALNALPKFWQLNGGCPPIDRVTAHDIKDHPADQQIFFC